MLGQAVRFDLQTNYRVGLGKRGESIWESLAEYHISHARLWRDVPGKAGMDQKIK
jgi:hypothetical protein